jgi:DNA polymerase-3 subunit delta'
MAKRKSAAPPPKDRETPARWTPLVGHERNARWLQRAVRTGRLGHAYLFVGPEGIGKRRFARHVAQTLLCEGRAPGAFAPCGGCASCVQVEAGSHPDYLEVRRPRDRTELPISAIQELVAQLALKPARGGRKIAVVDDADDLNEESANCFLKTLEEPPPRSLLILVSTSPDAQLPTIRSRCQTLRFDPLSESEVAEVLRRIGAAPTDEDASRMAALGDGSVGLSVESASPEWGEFRDRLERALLAEPVRSSTLAEEVLAFIEEAGKDAARRRSRAVKVVAWAAGLYRDALRAVCDSEWRGVGAKVVAYGRRVGPDALADLVDRCVEAERHIGRMAQLALAVETWLDDVGRLAAGQHVPPQV